MDVPLGLDSLLAALAAGGMDGGSRLPPGNASTGHQYLETALQVADMFTKQIFPKHFERLRRVMMGHENFDDMQARYVQVKASGDDMDDPKLYVDSKPGRPPK